MACSSRAWRSVRSAHRRRPFAEIFSGHVGLDPYTTAVSDVYQDVFGEGSYVGKGIYDVDAFERALQGRVPENSLLSHDLFEGLFARVALCTDIEVIDDYPTHYLTGVARLHRWVRGDWQLLPWLWGKVPVESGARARNVLPSISRWKIADNLRRSLLAAVSSRPPRRRLVGAAGRALVVDRHCVPGAVFPRVRAVGTNVHQPCPRRAAARPPANGAQQSRTESAAGAPAQRVHRSSIGRDDRCDCANAQPARDQETSARVADGGRFGGEAGSGAAAGIPPHVGGSSRGRRDRRGCPAWSTRAARRGRCR